MSGIVVEPERVEVQMHEGETNLACELANVSHVVDGVEVPAGEYCVVHLGTESIALSADAARDFAQMLLDTANEMQKRATS